MLLIWLQDGGGEGRGGGMAHLCVCVYCSLYLGWASDALAAAASGTHFKLAHATDDDDVAFRK